MKILKRNKETFTKEELHSIHEKLKILLRTINTKSAEHYTEGLCHLAEKYLLYGTFKDYKLFQRYMYSNIPIYCKIRMKLLNSSYWWKPGWILPRKLWLKKHYKLTKRL